MTPTDKPPVVPHAVTNGLLIELERMKSEKAALIASSPNPETDPIVL